MKLLEPYRVVGWDFDGALIDHPSSEEFATFVRRNPLRQTFHIVTFRSHGMQHNIERELALYNLRLSHFVSVFNIEDETYERYHRALRSHQDPEGIAAYVEWKGMICAQHGIEVLIDDMTDQVLPGCHRYGIAYVNPDDLS